MAQSPQQLPRMLWIGMMFVIAFLALAYLASLEKMKKLQKLPEIGPVADFTLTNQDGKITTLADLTNHVWIADIIFTRCAGPCPEMTHKMSVLQKELQKNNNVKLVTLTTDPDYDSPEILKRYGERFDADFNRWTFLTGTKGEIAALASGSLKIGSVPVKPEDQKNPADLFIHQTIFVIVDKHEQLRGVFETTGDGVDWTNDVEPRLLKAVSRLESEP